MWVPLFKIEIYESKKHTRTEKTSASGCESIGLIILVSLQILIATLYDSQAHIREFAIQLLFVPDAIHIVTSSEGGKEARRLSQAFIIYTTLIFNASTSY